MLLLVIVDFKKYAELRIEDLTGYGNVLVYGSFPVYEISSIKLCINPCRKPGYGNFPGYKNFLGYGSFPGFRRSTSHTIYCKTYL